jgi:hypothetical protein
MATCSSLAWTGVAGGEVSNGDPKWSFFFSRQMVVGDWGALEP